MEAKTFYCVKLAYFQMVLYFVLASYSEALPYRYREGPIGIKHHINCILLKMHPRHWVSQMYLKKFKNSRPSRVFSICTPFFWWSCTKLYTFALSFFPVCGRSIFYKPSQQTHRVKRIVQGNAADYGEWPWQISLMKRSKGNIHKNFSLF